MERRDNYAAQSAIARRLFLSYDQDALIRKMNLQADEDWIYTRFFAWDYRIFRKTGDMQRRVGGIWQEANGFNEVMTILDILCDSREDRCLARRWKNMTDFGLQFHRNFMEEQKNPFTWAIQENMEGFRSACSRMEGKPMKGADIAFEIPVLQELSLVLFFWEGDDEFAPRLRILWDENALQYMKYETMYYALNFLKEQLRSLM